MTKDSIYSVNTIADYVIMQVNRDSLYSLVTLKLQKLMYYIQAWSLRIRHKLCFKGEFEAWIHGPVNRELYDRFKSTKTLFSQITAKDISDEKAISAIDTDTKEFIGFVLDNYAGYGSVQLEAMTHNETPWKEARKGYSPAERCTVEISEKLMESYYAEKWKEINSQT